jgi:hypothetical protein
MYLNQKNSQRFKSPAMGVGGVSLELSAMAVWRCEDDRQVLGIVGA